MLLCGMLASGISHAEHHNPFGSTESLYLGEIPVVLSGTRLAQPLNESPVKGHDRDVGYLGLLDAFSRRMQVLIDGRTAYDPLVGGVNWATLPLDVEDIERIEVIRGPNAASFGTNAFLGTIIITTRHQFDPGRAHATLRTGSDEVLDVHAGFGDDTTPWIYHFTLGHREDDGFDTLHDGKRVNFLSGELARNLDTETRLELKAGYSSGDLEVEDSVGQRTVDTEDGYLMGRWQRDWNVDSGLTLTAYHQWTSWYESDRFTEFLGPFLLATDVVRDIDTSRSDLNLEHRFRLAPDWRGVWGGEARLSDLYRLFGHLEWQVADMAQASLGLMWEESDLMDAELSPRAGLVIHPAAGHTLRLSASHATRSPVIFEAYSDQGVTLDIVSPPPQAGCDAAYAALLGGAATFPAPCQVRSLLNWTRTPLEPEQITSYELGYRYGAGFGQLPGNVSADLKLFRKEIDDVTIGTFTSAPLSSNGLANVSGSAIDYFNAAEVTVDGIEGSIEWRLEPGTRLIGGFSLVNADAQNKLPGIVDDNEIGIGKIADSFPDYTLMAMLIHRFDGGLTTSLTGHYVDEVEYLGDGEFIKAQTRIDARVGYDLRVDRSRVRLAFTLQNLGNEYTDFDNDNVLGTRVLLSLQVEHP
jgi:iron complex outermembrane receptor protein